MRISSRGAHTLFQGHLYPFDRHEKSTSVAITIEKFNHKHTYNRICVQKNI